jgi:hypothetical protein
MFKPPLGIFYELIRMMEIRNGLLTWCMEVATNGLDLDFDVII